MAGKAVKPATPMCTVGKSNSPGFTLFELVVVLVVILALFGLVAPQMGSGILESGTRKTLRLLSGLTGEARNRAVVSGDGGRVVFDLERRAVRLEMNGRAEASDVEIGLPAGVDFAGVAKDIRTTQIEGLVELGVHPSGMLEPAMIYLLDEDGALLSVEVRAFEVGLRVFAGRVDFGEAPLPGATP